MTMKWPMLYQKCCAQYKKKADHFDSILKLELFYMVEYDVLYCLVYTSIHIGAFPVLQRVIYRDAASRVFFLEYLQNAILYQRS